MLFNNANQLLRRLKNLIRNFTRDTSGVVVAIDQVLLTTIMSIGVLAGLTAYRDSLVQEMGDVAVALDHLDQTYTYTVNGVTSQYNDTITLTDPAGAPPAGISVSVAVAPGPETGVGAPGEQ
jgi:Flp pilus assembly pilin Flp